MYYNEEIITYEESIMRRCSSLPNYFGHFVSASQSAPSLLLNLQQIQQFSVTLKIIDKA